MHPCTVQLQAIRDQLEAADVSTAHPIGHILVALGQLTDSVERLAEHQAALQRAIDALLLTSAKGSSL
jgi:hypothetical protein